MDDLQKIVNSYINVELLNFNNIKEYSLNGTNFREQILNRLFLQRYSKKSQSEKAKKYTALKVDNILKDNLPFIFCFCFGGYKHFWSPTYPEPDWAEIFTIKYFMEYVLPIAKLYDNGVTIEFESEEVILSHMNNVPQEGLDKYNKVFSELITYINQKTNYPLNLNLVLARDLYDKNELFAKMKLYRNIVEKRFNNLDEVEKNIRLKKTATNIMWNGVKDLRNLNVEEKNKYIFESRITNETFLDVDYELRGKEYFEKPNLIPLVRNMGIRYRR